MQNKFFCKNLILNILEKPNKNSKISSQIIYGEKFKILSKKKKYLKIKNLYDGYIGFVKSIILHKDFKPTHKVSILKSKIYYINENNKIIFFKRYLPFSSKIQIIYRKKNLVMFENNKWIKVKDIVPIKLKFTNYSKILKLFYSCPYRWGGRTYKGIDCSALIQIFFNFNEKYFPRDTVDQINFKSGVLAKKIFKKGDIIFWKGHVAICLNSKNLIHAYGPKKKVIIMPINKTINIIKKTANLEIKKIYSI